MKSQSKSLKQHAMIAWMGFGIVTLEYMIIGWLTKSTEFLYFMIPVLILLSTTAIILVLWFIIDKKIEKMITVLRKQV